MLSFLLDEHISDRVADQVARKRPEIRIVTLGHWEDIRGLGLKDEPLVRAAHTAGLTLVSYDQTTLPPLLVRFADEDLSHAGIILVDELPINSDDIGGLVRALIQLWDLSHDWDWSNRVMYLYPAP